MSSRADESEPARLERLKKELLADPDGWRPSADDRKFLDSYDRKCGQKDCLFSGLQWETDLEKAKQAAKASGRPILSLHLLGRLDEPLSCANSRFFRVLLYSNKDVSKFLKENFVLHWKTVRPVPKITIDFGDSRKIETTVTGNSLHYVLDQDGRVRDALPGLFSPDRFVAALKESLNAVKARDLGAYHKARLAQIEKNWIQEFKAAGLGKPTRRIPLVKAVARRLLPSASEAGLAAMSKKPAQIAMVAAVAPPGREKREPQAFDEPFWETLSAARELQVGFDDQSIALIRNQNPGAGREATLPVILGKLMKTVADDSLWNEYGLHAEIHRWFAEDGNRWLNLPLLNERIYAELFLTPFEDRWLGLLSPDAFTGVANNGVQDAKAPPR